MSRRIRTLFLEANGVGRRIVLVDTVLRGLLGYGDGAKPPAPLRRFRAANLLFGELADFNARLSYIVDWRDAFLAMPDLDVEVCNINNLVHYGRCLARIRDYDLVVISHAAAGDDMTLLTRTQRLLQRRRGKLVMFIGNEYDLLSEKTAFARTTGAEYVCTQLPIETARELYSECSGSEIVEMPHALNPVSYHEIPNTPRTTDVGFVGDIYWPFVGDRERTDLIEWFENHGAEHGLVCDIRRSRLTREEWNGFLNGCHAIVGAESGTYYLNERGQLLDRARHYNLHVNRSASFEDVFQKFYANAPRVLSGKSISSRHFEPIGTKTCQILVEGHYNGILQADRHYIPVRKDMSDIDDAIRKFKDKDLRERMVRETYEYVMEQHTYHHRVKALLNRLS